MSKAIISRPDQTGKKAKEGRIRLLGFHDRRTNVNLSHSYGLTTIWLIHQQNTTFEQGAVCRSTYYI
eukprot:scaffold369819_cov14-Prasinocladus_malaysianus.AAC.1